MSTPCLRLVVNMLPCLRLVDNMRPFEVRVDVGEEGAAELFYSNQMRMENGTRCVTGAGC